MDFIYSILGIVLFVVYIWAFIDVFTSKASDGIKIFFIVLMILFAYIGTIIWFLMRKRYIKE